MSQSDIDQTDLSYDPDLLFDKTFDLSKYVFQTSLEKICSRDNTGRSLFLSKLKEFYEIRSEEYSRIKANSKLVRDRSDSNFQKANNFKEKILRGLLFGMQQEREYVIDAYFNHLTELERKYKEIE